MNQEAKTHSEDVVAKSKLVGKMLDNAVAVMEDINRRDGRTMAMLRQKYHLPETLGALATAIQELAFALAGLFNILEAEPNNPSLDAISAQAREFEQDLNAKYADIVRDHDAGKMSDAAFADATAKVENMRSRAHVMEGELPKP